MDLKAAMEMLGQLAVKADTPKLLTAEAEPEGVYFAWDGKDMRRVLADPKPRRQKALSIETLVRALRDNGGGAQIWYSRSAVTGVYNHGTRREWITLRLADSVPMKVLIGWELSPVRQKQKPMLDALRVNLAGCLVHEPDLIQRIRDVKWRTSESGESSTGQGKASIGKRIEAEVSNLADMRDELLFDVPVFHGYPWAATVRTAFDVNPEDQTFTVRPVAGQIEAAYRLAEAQIANFIMQTCEVLELKCPVYYGEAF